MKIVSSGASDRGRQRSNNEDAFLADDELGLYIVADGMGGHAGGETASRVAVESLREEVRSRQHDEEPSGMPDAIASNMLARGFERANRSVLEAGLRDPALSGMGTTMTALLVAGSRMHLAHIGDSRAYLLRQGRLERLTEDHTLVGEQVRSGLLAPDQVKTSPYRHILTRAVGIALQPAADFASFAIKEGDVFLICSDGLTEMVADDEIGEVMAGIDVPRVPETLIESANLHGGVDNITVVVLRAASDR